MPERRPGLVPLDLDTNADGRADTAVHTDGVDLVLLTDLDGDLFADQVLRIGPDGVVREVVAPHPVIEGIIGDPAEGG
ncbi:hypothetical protein BJF78_12585 [Pseudonocardia sp. CNS-139]|nr:hypothetical protein BJF78_12585 [Pseudonocardia sp. CNS-139]